MGLENDRSSSARVLARVDHLPSVAFNTSPRAAARRFCRRSAPVPRASGEAGDHARFVMAPFAAGVHSRRY
jgi:hypothetical protein